jgi:DNA mismatch endonuclease (patch repair protein)
MSDVFTAVKRSQVMARIRSRQNASTELTLIAILRGAHLNGWRRNQPIFGRPDFVFHKQKLALFVDGCFWHGCPKCYRAPRQNRVFWEAKLVANRKRDRVVNRHLKAAGWKVIRIWEHDLRRQDIRRRALTKKIKEIGSIVADGKNVGK